MNSEQLIKSENINFNNIKFNVFKDLSSQIIKRVQELKL